MQRFLIGLCVVLLFLGSALVLRASVIQFQDPPSCTAWQAQIKYAESWIERDRDAVSTLIELRSSLREYALPAAELTTYRDAFTTGIDALIERQIVTREAQASVQRQYQERCAVAGTQ